MGTEQSGIIGSTSANRIEVHPTTYGNEIGGGDAGKIIDVNVVSVMVEIDRITELSVYKLGVSGKLPVVSIARDIPVEAPSSSSKFQ